MKKYNEKTAVGESGYLNKNCWLVKNLNYPPYKRCLYCDFKFRNCLFLQYQIISTALIVFFLALFFLIEGKISTLVIITILSLVIVYGYFFNNSTEKVIKANFTERKAKEALGELTEKLEQKVGEQTKDITEKSRYLQELLNMKNDFLRVVNHQLNTPLSILRNAFSLIKEGIYTPGKGMETANAGLERMGQTIQDFWDAFQLEGEKMKMKQDKINIAEEINDLIKEKKKMPLAIERKLKFKIEKPSFKIPLVFCDPKKISHVISNLLDNAVYYTRQGQITVSFELINDNFKINIKDTGVGILKEDKSKLFEKFSRGSNATNLRPDGSGLGLYICKKIVEGNKGEITFVSAGQDRGSTFSVTIPVYKNQRPTVKEEAITSRQPIIAFK